MDGVRKPRGRHDWFGRLEALTRLISGRANGSREDELVLIGEIGQVMRDASICGLGQLAANAVDSAVHRLKLFDGAAS